MEDTNLSQSPYELLSQALSLIPTRHYLFSLFVLCSVFLYNFLEFHFLSDTFLPYLNCRVNLIFNRDSLLYRDVVSRCRILHGRYVATPWLSSPHIQTCFLNFNGFPPVFNYKRELFRVTDGGTIALDWLMNSHVIGGSLHNQKEITKEDTTPIAVVVPGTAKSGWNVVISNHRGLGGVSVTSDCFYNAGWTEDIRVVLGYLQSEYPKAPLFAIGTSIGANILVKYLGEEGERTPLRGAVAICSPWDLLIGDRFISRKLKQRVYDRALTIGLQGYAQLHEPRYTRLANWEGIIKTVDTFYRKSSSTQYVGNVAVPLLCISALDDPLCTKEAIPWDECRANKNIVLATTNHGGHLAFFEGLTASSLWWVRATNEFLVALSCSSHMHVQKVSLCLRRSSGSEKQEEPSINQSPYVNMSEDGLVAAFNYKQGTNSTTLSGEATRGSNQRGAKYEDGVMKRNFKELCRQTKGSIWWLGYVGVIAGFPLLGVLINYLFKKKQRPTTSKS
ncbi:unnamed protein product [Cochlearia groenlandica]